jgi:glycosyltransferase involved in cell wall biosynthesis
MNTQALPITVVMPVYNSAATVARALNSVFAQSSPAQCVIVVDDGSTDDLAAALQPFADQIQLVRQDNAGAASARNRGVSLAQTELIAFLDADDYWHPQKLALQRAAFESNPDLHVCSTVYRFVPAPKAWEPLSHAPAVRYADFGQLFKVPYLGTPSVVLRKSAFVAAGQFRSNYRCAEDVDLWLRLGWLGPVARLPDTLVTVVTTPGSLTGLRRDGVYVDNLQVIEDFIGEHPDFLQRYWVQARRARALIYEQWGSGALAARRLGQARRLLLQSCLQWPTRRPMLLLCKALLLTVRRFFGSRSSPR